MLGWFKKKFGKQATAPQAVEPGQQKPPDIEEVAAAPTEEVLISEAAGISAVEVADTQTDVIESPPAEEPEAVAIEAVAGVVAPAEAAPVEVEPEQSDEAAAESESIVSTESMGQDVLTAVPVNIESPPEASAEQEAETGNAQPPLEETAVEESPAEEPEAAEPETPAEPESPPELNAGRTQEKPASKSLFQRLQERLGKTRDAFIYRLDRLFLGKKEIDQDLLEQLEELLITADLGVGTTLELLDVARKKIKRDQLSDPQALKTIIRDQILAYIEASEQPAEMVMPEEGPFVIMVVGVNGVGKTTTIGKLAAKFVRSGQSVLLIAADTFRAAAINQLKIWGERVGVEVIAQNPGADPSSVVFDGLEYGVAHQFDVIVIDTAGRLHTSVNLMEELKKIRRVIGKKMPGAPHEVMLVLDATTGQNGISQAKLFHEAVGVTGLALTKLDGTAKGGIVANVCREIRIPVRFIGIGEQIDDLRDFDAREFVDALFASQVDG